MRRDSCGAAAGRRKRLRHHDVHLDIVLAKPRPWLAALVSAVLVLGQLALGVKSRGVVSFRCSLWVGGGQAVR